MISIRKEIVSYLSDFLRIISLCMNSTEYKKDIPIYKRDYEVIKNFIEEMSDPQKNIQEIVNKILEDQTAKILTDYWRVGKYGELECNEFHNLRVKIRSLTLSESYPNSA